MRRVAPFASAIALFAVLAAGCGGGGTTKESPYLQRWTALETCLKRDGYTAGFLTAKATPWLPGGLAWVPLPFVSKTVRYGWLMVGWRRGGIGQPSISVEQWSTAAAARARARRRVREGIATEQIATFVFDREPGDDKVAAAIVKCIKPSSSRHLRHIPDPNQTDSPLASALRPVVVRGAQQPVFRIRCSQRPISSGATLCAVTFEDGACEVWQIKRITPSGADAARMTPWQCTVVFGNRPNGLG